MRNETDRDTIEQATVLYLTEKTAATTDSKRVPSPKHRIK
jgi:hypothetical protein